MKFSVHNEENVQVDLAYNKKDFLMDWKKNLKIKLFAKPVSRLPRAREKLPDQKITFFLLLSKMPS